MTASSKVRASADESDPTEENGFRAFEAAEGFGGLLAAGFVGRLAAFSGDRAGSGSGRLFFVGEIFGSEPVAGFLAPPTIDL